MDKKLKRTVGAAAALTLALSVCGVTAFAAEGYSYLDGQQRSRDRNALYEQAAVLETEEERQAFLAENGIAEAPYSEEAKQAYSYVGGRQRGAAYRTEDGADDETAPTGDYSYVGGRQRGAARRTEDDTDDETAPTGDYSYVGGRQRGASYRQTTDSAE